MDFKRFFNLFEDAARATERPAPTGQNSFVSIGSGHCRLERGLVFARVTAVTGNSDRETAVNGPPFTAD